MERRAQLRLREMEAGLRAFAVLVDCLAPRQERVEQVLGVLTAAEMAGEVTREGVAEVLRWQRRAGWRFADEVDAEGWVAELVRKVRRGEVEVS